MNLLNKPLQQQLPSKRELELKAVGYKLVVGVDEAGRGPLAGPVVAAACMLPNGCETDGLNDSKKLSVKRRDALFDQLIQNAYYGIGIVEHEKIDEINILQATHLAMRKAVAALAQKPDFILVDGHPVSFPGIPSEGVIKGDAQEQLIAAASILAKVTRDKIMLRYHDLYPEYGFAAHKGYGTILHKEALHKHGRCPIHRLSFSY